MLRLTCLLVTSALACTSPQTHEPAAKPLPAARCDSVSLPANATAFVLAGFDFVRQARTKSEPGLYRNAEACAQEALALEPSNAQAQRLSGLVLLNDHRFGEARDLARRMLARDDSDALSWGTLSDAYLELGELGASIDAAQHMLDLKPSLPSYGRAAHLTWLQGDVAAARRLYELAIASGTGYEDPEPRAWMIVQAAWVFWHEGDHAGAQAGFDLALHSVPGYAPALEGKGRAALSQGDYPAAVRWLERAHRSRPLVETAWWLGDAHALLGDQARAKYFYEEVERQGKRHDPRSLALFYAVRDREPQVALTLARAEYAQRKDVYTKDALAFAAYRSGLQAEAERLAADILASGVPDARLRYRAGLIRNAHDVMRDALRQHPGLDPILTGGRDALADHR